MRKFLLLLSFLCSVLTMSAQNNSTIRLDKKTQAKALAMKQHVGKAMRSISVPKDDAPIYDPEGKESLYIMSYTDNDGFMEANYTNGKVRVRTSDDGKTLYFNSLTPGGNRETKGAKESWIKGTRSGNDITVKAGQVLVQNDVHTLYLQIAHVTTWGDVEEFEEETHFTVGEDGTLSLANTKDQLIIYKESDEDGYFSSFGMFSNLKLQPMGELTSCQFPDGATPEQYILKGYDLYQDANTQRMAKVAFDGDKCYMAGLSTYSPDEVFEGTVKDGEVTMPAGQIVKDADLYFFRLIPIVFDEEFNGTPKQSFVFKLSDSNHTLTLSPEDVSLCETDYGINTISSALKGITLTYYPGDKAAKPATPSFLKYDEYNSAFYINVPQNDIDGGYINPDKLTYRFYADGELYTFKPDTYIKLTGDMTDIPFSFADNYDFYSNPNYKVVCFYNLSANYIEVESAYTVDGVTNLSDRARYDLVETGISGNKAEKAVKRTIYTSLQGIRLTSPAKGSIVLKTTIYGDGTRSTVKTIIK